MKKFSTFLSLMAMFLLLPFGARAQEELTVFEGTATSYYVPAYVFYWDDFSKSQFVIPADSLVDMVGATITSVKFYTTSDNIPYTSTSVADMFIKEVDYTSISAYEAKEGVVYSGIFSFVSEGNGGSVTIEFTEPYVYQGGNLLIGIENTTDDAYKQIYFYGQTVNGASIAAYNSNSLSGVTSATQRNFIPKTTFTYTTGDICYKVRGLEVETTTTSLDLSWVDTMNSIATYTVELINGADTNEVASNLTETNYTITGLTANTMYTVRVKASCSAESASAWTTKAVRTNCDAIALPFVDGFENYEASSFPPCWTLLKGYTSSSAHYPYVNQSSSAPEGGKYLYCYTSSSSDSNFFRTDLIPIAANDMHIYFRASGSSIKVGYMTDPTDRSSFVLLTNCTSGWAEYDIYTDTLSDNTQGIYLAFIMTGSSYSYGYVDAVRVEQSSTCRRPLRGSISDITYHSGQANWVADPNGEATEWDVIFSRVNGNPDTMEVTASAVNDTFYMADNLLPYTTYYVWTRANCGTEESMWLYIGSFTTDRSCFPLENVTVGNVNYTSAYVSWDYAGRGRGLEETGVHLTLRDTASIVREWDMTVDDGTSTFITDLQAGTTYTLELRTFCDPDTATGVVRTISTSSCGEESGTSTTSYTPFHGNYRYGVTQALYPASTVSGMTAINSLSWRITSSATNYPNRTIDVFMGYTDQTTLDVSSPIDTASLTKVVTGGQLNVSQVGWTTIQLDQPFAVNASAANIVVMVVNRTGQYSSITWGAHSGVGIYAYQDSPVPSRASDISVYSSSYRSNATTVADIRFGGDCNISCVAPNIILGEVGMTSVSLEWVAGMDESEWAVQYRADSVNSWSSAANANGNSTTIDGLSARTKYHFRMGTICESGDTMWSNIVSSYTLCEPLYTLPFTEGFEGMPTNQDPLCWQVYQYGSSSNSHYVSSSQKHSGSNSMDLYPYGVQYLVSPLMPEGTVMSELEVNFWARLSNSGRRFEVGYMTDPADTNTFRLLGSYSPNNNTWTEYTVYGDTSTLSEAAYVAFRWYVVSGYHGYVDDITIREATCRRPTGLHTTDLTHESATVAFNGQDGGVYEYCITTSDTIPDSVLAELQYSQVAELIFEELNSNTTYHVWVRTVCDNNTTNWSTMTFTTLCTLEEAPWGEDFDSWTSLSTCWKRYTGAWGSTPTLTAVAATNTDLSNFRLTTTQSHSMFNTKSLIVNTYSTNKSWIMTPPIHVATPVALNFEVGLTKYNSTSPATFDNSDREFRVAVSSDGGSTWTSVATWGTGSNYTYAYNTLSRTPQSYTVLLDYTDQNILIAFYVGANSSGDDNDLFIDNIMLQSTDCMRPTNVEVETAAESAIVSWNDYSSSNDEGYELIVSPRDTMSAVGAVTLTIGAGDTSAVVEDLLPQTTYYYFLRSLCDENPTESRWVHGSFRTQCTERIPIDENFDSYSTGSGNTPECWTVVSAYTTSYGTIYPYVTTSSNHGKVLYMYNYSTSTTNATSIATPRIPAPLNELEIHFEDYGINSSSGAMSVYAATNPSDVSSYTLITRVQPSYSNWSTRELTTDTVPALANLSDTGYIVFAVYGGYSSYGANYVDNVYITKMNPCRRTDAVTVSDVTYSGATLSWTEVEGAAGYRVKYSQLNNAATADSVDVNTNEYTLDGLSSESLYYVWVYTLCGDGISDARSTSFQTDISCYPIVNLTQSGLNGTTVAYMWDVDPRGTTAQSVNIVLEDLTEESSETIDATGLGYHMFTDLTPGHNYKATFRTVCDVDSASGVTVTFTPVDNTSCLTIEGAGRTERLPFHTNYNRGYAQMIYKAEELSGIDSIYGLGYYVKSVPTDYTTRMVDIYLANTTRSTVSTTNVLPVDSLTLVASNVAMNVSQTGWTYVNLTTPFQYDGSSNLMVVMQNRTGHYRSFYFGAYKVESGRIAMWYSDNDSCSASTIGTSGASKYDTLTMIPAISIKGNCETTCTSPIAALSNVDSMSVEVVWTGDNDSYKIQYRRVSDVDWSEMDNVTSPTTVSNLQPSTDYIIRVVGICNDFTYNSRTMNFTTDCAPVNIPLHFTQNDVHAAYTAGKFPNCWDYNSFIRSYSGSTYYFYSSNSSSWLALPEVVESISGLQLRTLAAGTGAFKVGVMENDGSITWVETVALPGSSVSAAEEYVVYLDSYNGTGNRIVVGNTSSSSVYHLDFHVEPLETCRPVENVTVSNITTTTASVSWTPDAGQSQWLVYVNGTLHGTATAIPYTLTGLSASTSYTVSVRAHCGAGDTSRVARAEFATLCGAINELPWSENFDSYSASSSEFTPNCWEHIGGGYTNIQSSGNYTYSGNSLRLYPNSQSATNVVVLPEFATDINNLKISMQTRPEGSNSGSFAIGYITNVTDPTTFVAVETYTTSDFNNGSGIAFQQKEVAFSGVPTGARIAIAHIVGSTAWYWFVDEIEVTLNGTPGPGPQPEECNAPVITSANATDNSIVLQWTGETQSYEWNIVEGANWTNPSAGNLVSGTTVTIDELTANTQYTVGVRTVCTGGERSAWATRTVSTTNVGIEDVLGESFVLYPNPATVSVTVELAEAGMVSILDAAGRESGKWSVENGHLTIDLSGYSAGAYYVRVVTAQGTAVRKLIVR